MPKPNFLHKYRVASKFGNIPKSFNGRLYHSTLEAQYAETLNLLMRAGELKLVEAQPSFTLSVNSQKICVIKPDFLVVTKHDEEQIHEVKSLATQTPIWKVKWRLLQALHPEFKYFVIQRGDF